MNVFNVTNDTPPEFYVNSEEEEEEKQKQQTDDDEKRKVIYKLENAKEYQNYINYDENKDHYPLIQCKKKKKKKKKKKLDVKFIKVIQTSNNKEYYQNSGDPNEFDLQVLLVIVSPKLSVKPFNSSSLVE
ncbi:hypothetical protein BCR32DRAFT_248462 [Anaeromyces robustus]|uniref:Uncharacterized protein n=1 Tax=Anaeromyces robustus TaxID=1754192 RepID=A0A1Y1WTM0_9FUNG|nr:hypothetical protein BCR32DRAFT_248462 [Anaeromyces robustus]|eukprot:ORX76792.1 hypothetical protein BCR32DRAFT_248462 [Anaeromyces robustus]